MQEMETAFVTVLRLWIGLWGVIGLIVAFRGKSEFRWGRRGKGPLMRPQWLGRLLFAIAGAFLIAIAVLLKVAPKR
jgi:uncharacterized membrane protein HdeD (DUF308 family)